MNAKHAPRPWICVPTSHHAHDYRLETPGGQMPFVRGSGVEYATAKLIQAAPDLLAEAQALLNVIDSGEGTIAETHLAGLRAAVLGATQ